MCSGHRDFVVEASNRPGQSADPAQSCSNHGVSPGLVLIPWCCYEKAEMFKWKVKESPLSYYWSPNSGWPISFMGINDVRALERFSYPISVVRGQEGLFGMEQTNGASVDSILNHWFSYLFLIEK